MHSSVAVRIPADVELDKVSAAIDEVLGPYNEDAVAGTVDA